VKKFLNKFKEIIVYGDNQALEITSAGCAILLAPMLSSFLLSCPYWLISSGIILGFCMIFAIGWDTLYGRMICMRLLWGWYCCIIILEIVGGTHSFMALHTIWWEWLISTYNVWRISREYLYRKEVCDG
tara:strand:- start:112 stop:498 length:387 start_codon:yes stop_codon:yes gene_type:complete